MPTNAWYTFKYAVQAPHYDKVVRFPAERQRSIELAGLRPGELALIIGAGTGLDLVFVPDGVRVLALDLSPAMLARAAQRGKPGVIFALADAHRLPLRDSCVDAVVLHMVLEVVQYPARCLTEAARVLRPGGRAAVFDKFLPDGSRMHPLKTAALELFKNVFTTTTLTMAGVLEAAGSPLDIEHDEACSHEPYRYVLLRKPRPYQR